MTYYIPNPTDRRIIQENENDFSGNLFSSKNINLEKGYFELSSGVAILTREIDGDDPLDDFKLLYRLRSGNGDLIIKADDTYFTNGSNSVGFEEMQEIFNNDSNTPIPDRFDDIIFFNGGWVASESSSSSVKIKDIAVDGNTWADTFSITTGDDDEQVILKPFEHHSGLMVGHKNEVYLRNTDLTENEKLVLPSNFYVTSIDTIGHLAYIGTYDTNGEQAKLFIWDGNSSAHNNSYGAQTWAIGAVKNHQSSIICVLINGRLVRFNGGGFDELSKWPVFNTNYIWSHNATDYVSKDGIVTDGDNVYLNVKGEVVQLQPENYLRNQPGGVWTFHPENGMYHKHAPSSTQIYHSRVLTTNVNTTENSMTIETSIVPITGTPCRYEPAGGSSDAILSETDWFYVIKESDTVFKLASSRKNALAGEALDFPNVGNSQQEIIFYPERDYGQLRAEHGGLIIGGLDFVNGSFAEPLIFTTTGINTEESGNSEALCIVPPGLYNRGYFVTPKIYSINKSETFKPIEIRYRPLGKDDEIVVKVKMREYVGLPTKSRLSLNNEIMATWKGLNSLKVDASIDDTADSRGPKITQDLSMIKAGDEIEIIDGLGSGQLFHISDVSKTDSNVYTYTLDEDCYFAVADERCEIIIDRWRKLGVINFENQNEETSLRIDEPGDFIQAKVELRGQNPVVIDVKIGNEVFKPLV